MWNQIEDEALDFIRSRAWNRGFEKDTLVTGKDGKRAYVFLLESGTLCGEVQLGTEPTPLRFMKKGQSAVLTLQDNIAPLYQFRALSPCRIRGLYVDDFLRALLKWPGLNLQVVAYLARRGNLALAARAQGVHLKKEAQVAHLYWWLSEPVKGSQGRRLMDLPIPQKTLAAYLAIPREELNRKLKTLEQDGYLARTANGIDISPSMTAVFTEGAELLPDSGDLIAYLLEPAPKK